MALLTTRTAVLNANTCLALVQFQRRCEFSGSRAHDA
jgi:hypothetical protein